MGNSSSNQTQNPNNIEISRDEYKKYQQYLIEKQKRENTTKQNTAKQNNSINKKNMNMNMNRSPNMQEQFNKLEYNNNQPSNIKSSQYDLDKNQYNYHQKGKNIINNKISDYQLNSNTALRSQFIPVIAAESNNRKDEANINNDLYQEEINKRSYNSVKTNDTYLPRLNSYMNNQKDNVSEFEHKIKELDRDRKVDNVAQFYENIESEHNTNYKEPNNNENNLFDYEIDYSILDPFNILKKKNLPLEQLKLAYKKLSLVHHPDKGGDINEFKKLINAYNYIDKVIKTRQEDKSHLELKNSYNENINNENGNGKVNEYLKEISSKDKFNINRFNEVFSESKLENPQDRGYSNIMTESSKNREDIEIDNNIGKFTKKNFADNFENNKKNKTSNYVVKYTPPEPVNMGKLFYSELGEDNINNFSSKTESMNLTDYKEAHVDNFMIDPNKINYKKYKNIEDLEKDREVLKMSEDQMKAIEENDELQKKYEWNRINNLRQKDNEISKQFERTNKLYLQN